MNFDMKYTIKIFKNAKRGFLKLILCHLLQDHQWTSPADEGKPIASDINVDNCEIRFYQHCRMTCKRCGVEAEPSKRMLNRIMKDYANARN